MDEERTRTRFRIEQRQPLSPRRVKHRAARFGVRGCRCGGNDKLRQLRLREPGADRRLAARKLRAQLADVARFGEEDALRPRSDDCRAATDGNNSVGVERTQHLDARQHGGKRRVRFDTVKDASAAIAQRLRHQPHTIRVMGERLAAEHDGSAAVEPIQLGGEVLQAVSAAVDA